MSEENLSLPEDGGPSWRMYKGGPKAPAPLAGAFSCLPSQGPIHGADCALALLLVSFLPLVSLCQSASKFDPDQQRFGRRPEALLERAEQWERKVGPGFRLIKRHPVIQAVPFDDAHISSEAPGQLRSLAAGFVSECIAN
jgi:hypothetical protein